MYRFSLACSLFFNESPLPEPPRVRVAVPSFSAIARLATENMRTPATGFTERERVWRSIVLDQSGFWSRWDDPREMREGESLSSSCSSSVT